MPTIKVRKDGNLVYVIYSHLNENFKVFTGVKVEDEFWSICAPKKNCPDYEKTIKLISAMEKRVLNASMLIRSQGIDPTVERVREAYQDQARGGPIDQSFWFMYREFIDGKNYNSSTKRKGELFMKNLENFCTWSGYHFHINTWDQLMFGRFIQYLLIHQKMSDSTIKTLVKGIKTFLRTAYPRKDLSWMKHTLITSEKEIVALTEGELKNLIDADLGGYLEKTRDLFVFLCTTGMRFSDSQLFNPSWVTEEKILEFSQLKTGVTAYPPLYEASRRVLLKYDGIPPQISNQKFNEYLKELFEELKLTRPVTTQIIKNGAVYQSLKPLSAVVSSLIARSTFTSICLQKGMPVQYVMQMLGHNDYKTMLPYIKAYQQNISNSVGR